MNGLLLAADGNQSAGQLCILIAQDDLTARLERGDTLEQIAADTGTSSTYLSYARAVVRYLPELCELVLAGEMNLDQAYERTREFRRLKGPDDGIYAPSIRRKQTAERIRRMAQEGYSEADIAESVGHRVGYVRKALREQGVLTLREKLGTNQSLDADRVMSKLVLGAAPPLEVVQALDWSALDPQRMGEWDEQLSAAIRTWTTVRTKLRWWRRRSGREHQES